MNVTIHYIHRIKENAYIIISKQKKQTKSINHDKYNQQIKLEEYFLILLKGSNVELTSYLTSYLILKTDYFPLTIRNKANLSTFTFIQYCTEDSSQYNKKKKIKDINRKN